MSVQLQFLEPSIGLQDRTDYIAADRPITINMVAGQRATATVTLNIPYGDAFVPGVGWPVYIRENSIRVFAGITGAPAYHWLEDAKGWMQWTLTCVDLMQALDEIRARPQVLTNVTCGSVVTTLLSQFPTLPLAAGTITAGPTLASFVCKYDRVSDLIDNLAKQAEFIYGIDPSPSTPELYFRAPTVVPAGFTFTSEMLQWLSLDYRQTRQDFRDRQIIKAAFPAFAPSVEVFTGDGHTAILQLRNPVDHLVDAALTTGNQAAVTGTFTGQPAANDTITVGDQKYTFVSTLDNTEFGQVLIGASSTATAQNFADAVNSTDTLKGSTFSLPTWECFWGNATVVSAGVIRITTKATGTAASRIQFAESCGNFSWASGGGASDPAGSGTATTPVLAAYGYLVDLQQNNDTITLNGNVYTFKTTINNSNPREVLIDNTLRYIPGGGYAFQVATTAFNLIDAILANPLTSGTKFSSATVVNPDYTTDPIPFQSGYNTNTKLGIAAITLYAKTAAAVSLASSATSRFEWTLVTPPGTSEAGATNPEDISTPVEESDVAWQTGSSFITLKDPAVDFPAGTNLVVTYYRLGAECIAVEDSTLVATRATAENGTGRVDQLVDDSQNVDCWNALAKAQSLLTLYSTLPKELSFDSYKTGWQCGDLLPISLTAPTGAGTLLNGDWLIQSVDGVMVPYLSVPPYSTGDCFKWRVTVISSNVVSNFIRFWELLAQVGSGTTGSTGALLALAPAGSGGGGGGGGGGSSPLSQGWTEEEPAGPMDGTNVIFTLTHVPATDPITGLQIVNLTKNGVTLSPFAYGSPAVGNPDYSVSYNVITLDVAPNPDDYLEAKYFPTVGVPTEGTLQATAAPTIISSGTKPVSPTGAYNAAYDASYSTDGSIFTTFVSGRGGSASSGWVETTDSASWNFGGGSLPSLTNFKIRAVWGHSLLSNGPPDSYLYIYDVYLDFVYNNLDPSLPTITHRYRPQSVLIQFEGEQATMTASAGPATATLDCFHTGGLSTAGHITWSGFIESQVFING